MIKRNSKVSFAPAFLARTRRFTAWGPGRIGKVSALIVFDGSHVLARVTWDDGVTQDVHPKNLVLA